MAVCEIWDVRGRLDHPIDYAENPEKTANPNYSETDLQALVDVMEYATNQYKTEQRFFVTGVNCDPASAREGMMKVRSSAITGSRVLNRERLRPNRHTKSESDLPNGCGATGFR